MLEGEIRKLRERTISRESKKRPLGEPQKLTSKRRRKEGAGPRPIELTTPSLPGRDQPRSPSRGSSRAGSPLPNPHPDLAARDKGHQTCKTLLDSRVDFSTSLHKLEAVARDRSHHDHRSKLDH